MTDWGKSFAGVDAAFELLFERFEVLASLAEFQDNDEARLEAALASPAQREVLSWMPVGRAGWRTAGTRLLLQELEDEARIAELLKAGFAKGSHRFLQLFAENFKRFAGRMSW
jgi:hypothetical protein